MKQNILMQLQTQQHSFSGTGKTITQYILEDPERTIQSNVRQVAKDTGISEASIVRFCRSIGLEGFADLKIQLIKCVSSLPIPSVFEEIDETESMESVARNVFTRNLITLQTAMQQMDFSQVAAAAELLRQAKQIVVCGLGVSASIAENCYVHLFRAGLPAIASTDPELMQIFARKATEDTVFLAISKGGRSRAVVNALQEARSHGAKTVSITANDKTPLTEVSDVALVHYAPTRAMVSTRVVQNTIVDCLYICATRHQQQDVINQILENRRVADFLRSSE